MMKEQIQLVDFYDYASNAIRGFEASESDQVNVGYINQLIALEYIELDLAIDRNNVEDIGKRAGEIARVLSVYMHKSVGEEDSFWSQATKAIWHPTYTATLPHESLKFIKRYLSELCNIFRIYFLTKQYVAGHTHIIKKLILNILKALVDIQLAYKLNPTQSLFNNIENLNKI